MSTPSRYIIRFAVHIKDVYRRNYLAEIAENTGADTRELSDGRIEITGFRPKKSGEVLDALKQKRGVVLSLLRTSAESDHCNTTTLKQACSEPRTVIMFSFKNRRKSFLTRAIADLESR